MWFLPLYHAPMTELWSLFQNNDGNIIHKWTHYFPAYEEHFSRFKNRPAVLVEIGVFKGGSLELWKKFLGPRVQVVGIDIEDKSEYEQDQIAIRQGDQSDPVFLQSVIDEFGPPDIIIDDGSHQMEHVTASFEFFYPRMSPTGVYFVEDMHTAYWPEYGGGLRKADTFIEKSKHLIDELNADHARGALAPTDFTRSTLSIHFFDSCVIFEKGRHLPKHDLMIGKE